MINLTKLQNRLNNCIESRHSTEHLPNCRQCGKKPVRGYSHTAFLGCECSVMSGDGYGDLEQAWKVLQGDYSEREELRGNLAEAHRAHNMYRANMMRLVDQMRAFTYKLKPHRLPDCIKAIDDDTTAN